MDERPDADTIPHVTEESEASEPQLPEASEPQLPEAAEPQMVEETSTQYLGRWNRLISTTNWEKGCIISEWRDALIAAGAPPADRSDEAWSRRVGNITPQHAGRLRRVFKRFGESHQKYKGLYWSHFQAAFDWPDPEMWLEGAVQNDWSVAQMRDQRWEAIGAPDDKKPREEDIISAELDEDVALHDGQPTPETVSDSFSEVQDAEPAMDDESGAPPVPTDQTAVPPEDLPEDGTAAEPFRPFENLAPLPPDLNEPFESLKLAVLHHKLAGWREISASDVVASLDALKQLALAPPDD